MEQVNSWLVYDDEKKWHSRWQAWVILIAHSPLFFYLAPLLKLKIFSFIGDKCYRKVAGNRNILAGLLPTLKERPISPNKVVSIVLNGFFLFMFYVYNNVECARS